MNRFQPLLSLISGTLLITGTCVGAGMLGIPLVTQEAGFYPALVINTLCWLLMMATGLLFLEVTLWMRAGANLLSMARRFLGPSGKIVGGATFLFLYYCLMVAYMAAGVPLMQKILGSLGFALSNYLSTLLFCLLFGGIVFMGVKLLDRLNLLLVVGLVVSYLLLLVGGSSFVDALLFERQHWSLVLFASPVLFSAYGYHNIIPSLSSYLGQRRWALRWSIILGTFLPFVIYTLWQWMIIGAGAPSQLQEALDRGEPVTMVIERALSSHWLGYMATYFSFFALTTSLLGVALSMADFLADGLKVVKTKGNWLLLCLMVFLPPAFIALLNPHVFIAALGYAGGFGEALLNGLLPIAMVWAGRYGKKKGEVEGHEELFPGGKGMLTLLFLGTLTVVAVEIFQLFR